MLNQSLPAPGANTGTSEHTTAKYNFPGEADPTPYLVRIPQTPPVTLAIIKHMCPKRNYSRFYFKTEIDGEEIFLAETNDSGFVPMWKGSVVVQCHAE